MEGSVYFASRGLPSIAFRTSRGKIAAPMWICYFASKKLQVVAMSRDIHT